MTAPLPVMRSGFKVVGRGLRVRFTLVDGSIEAEWQPRNPVREDKEVLPAYQRARNAFLSTVVARTGTNILVVDL